MRNGTRGFLVAVGIIAATLSSPLFAVAASPPRVPLTSVEAVTDPSAPPDPKAPGAGGGIDASTYFTRRLASNISRCTDKVRDVASNWFAKNHFPIVRQDQKPGDLLMHATVSSLSGMMELTYTVDLTHERARVTLFYYRPDGGAVAPTQVKLLLQNYRVGALEDALTAAILCGTK